ncbi:hypothetical protein THRCLA_11222 [Thraustotheca clavata]|uniref:Uncharacterized protein n=1 Tax=Thraustotheca clavata TaxID=74557 RepID=A0A1V9Y8F4_9STRA|nr:hypothetical protein THRCLA_11222 [Thraustotheca clavata]
MSFLERFGDKISTVTMHGTLKKIDGSEEVRSGPMRKKPQPPSALQPVGKSTSNNAPEQFYVYKEEPQDAVNNTKKAPSPVKKKTSPKKVVKPIEKLNPNEINEQKAVTEQDQLAFSKKARATQYEPCTLSEYKQEKPMGYYELGKLKPDLNAEDLIEKRANKERIKEFSKNLRQINQNLKKKEVLAEVVPEKTLSNREKAMAFAKEKIPKPKVVKKLLSPKTKPAKNDEKVKVQNASDEEETIQSELHQLQLKHRAARAQVEALMRDN